MTRRFVILLVASALSFVGGGVWAQKAPPPPILGPAGTPHPTLYRHLTIPPEVLSGENLGVRVASALAQDGTIKGTLVVRINGEWVDVLPATGSAGK
jgi:hypothetical protein